ncbi:hypothetical protein CPU12_10785 [Malaciobacter molluscorum LMG 25693]|uniref:Uncharacterized protein n=1 Tax=Malaciobacter molluscorum LMG 25693 TaxID=870501 RepID=A0A2G1DFW9_9BACT|nr:hypothetical protein [Malaciobacter molluscorum]AXX91710.1 hypothetical protein AMOL_0712 [Malaciobacter molluscorum LMG 25693]PHO17402.1 hypothetical protein CPU12_10785 [Malaciobacter molluscorum LMG 25693]RXJ92829.1 hypothetical protein CRV00_12470 [Malaciobacter molluscorum]
MAKTKQSSVPMLLTIIIFLIIILIFMVLKSDRGLMSGIFSPSGDSSKPVNQHMPRPLQWEKPFRFGHGDNNDGAEENAKGGGSQNFLQYESSKNKK